MLVNSTRSPTHVGQQALHGISFALIDTGNPLDALKHAKIAHEYAEQLGDIYAQAHSLYLQARCQSILANYQCGQILLKNSRDLLAIHGLQGSTLDLTLRNHEAEIHFWKSEYLKSRKIQVAIASSRHPTTYQAILANMFIALIDTVTGADFELVFERLKTCRIHSNALYGHTQKELGLWIDTVVANLYLRERQCTIAQTMFKNCFTSSRNVQLDARLFCLERLADSSTGLNDMWDTLRWAVIFFVLSLKGKEKLATTKALCYLGNIYIAMNDQETAMSLFRVALDAFEFMDINHWRAHCMVNIADILWCQGEVTESIGLWKAARPLLERSLQTKEVMRVDEKLQLSHAEAASASQTGMSMGNGSACCLHELKSSIS